MPGLGSLVSGIKPISNVATSDVYITELDENGKPRSGLQHTRRFQYFPESISDTKAINWSTKEIPGGSLPLYQYVNSGERILSFTAVFTTDVDHFKNGGGASEDAINQALTQFNTSAGGGGGVAGGSIPSVADTFLGAGDAVERMYDRLKGSGVLRRNVYIPAGLLWLRRFMHPRYSEETAEVGSQFTFPPRKLMLTLPGTKIEMNGGGGTVLQSAIVCVMTQCDITYESLFPSGNPRIVTVALSFAQVPQLAGKVAFPRWDQAADDFVDRLYSGPFVPSNRGGSLGL